MELSTHDFEQLLEAGYCFRHDMERWENLQRLGATAYPSPRRQIEVEGCAFMEELIQPPLELIKLTAQEVDVLERLAPAWEKLVAAQVELVRLGLNGDPRFQEIADAMVPSDQRELALADSGYPDPIAPFLRLDMLRAPTGWLAIDINSTRPGGIGYQLTLLEMLAEKGVSGLFPIRKVFCATMRRCYRRWAESHEVKERARLAVVISPSSGEWNNFMRLVVVLKDEPWLESVEVTARVPAPDDSRFNCVLRSRIKSDHQDFVRLRALPVDRFCIISPLARRWVGDKHWFLWLRLEPVRGFVRERVGAEDFDLILSVMPETGMFLEDGRVRFTDRIVDPTDSSQLCRNDWIMKPGSGSSAHGIVIGRSKSAKMWRAHCTGPATRGALLQRFLRVKSDLVVAAPQGNGDATKVSHYLRYGAYLYGGQLATVEVMSRPMPLVHGARDAYYACCLKEEGGMAYVQRRKIVTRFVKKGAPLAPWKGTKGSSCL